MTQTLQGLRHLMCHRCFRVSAVDELYGFCPVAEIFTQLQELGVDLPVALAVSLCISAAPAPSSTSGYRRLKAA